MELFVDIEKQVGGFCLRSSFSVESGRLALLGPSGCGKTTFLDAALLATGVISRLGKVEDGTGS